MCMQLGTILYVSCILLADLVEVQSDVFQDFFQMLHASIQRLHFVNVFTGSVPAAITLHYLYFITPVNSSSRAAEWNVKCPVRGHLNSGFVVSIVVVCR